MRIPRVRFTIRRLMVAVLASGLILWAGSVIRSRLNPTIAEQQAQASYAQARLVREVAEYEVKEYENSIYLQAIGPYEGKVAYAQTVKEWAVYQLKRSNEMLARGRIPQATNIADQLAKQQADFELEQAQTQLKVLKNYTKDKQIKMLKGDVEKARAVEAAKLADYQHERARRLWSIGF